MTAYFSLVHLFYVVVLVFDFVVLILLVKCNDSTLVIAISKHFGDDGAEGRNRWESSSFSSTLGAAVVCIVSSEAEVADSAGVTLLKISESFSKA